MSADITIYTTAYCGFCHRAKALLSEIEAPFTEVDVGQRPELRQWLVKETSQRTVPQVFINNQSVGGCTELLALHRSGELQGMLAQVPQAGLPALPR